MKRSTIAIVLSLALGIAPSAQELRIALDPIWDSIGLASGLASSLATKFALSREGEAATFERHDAAELSGLDALACFAYGEGEDRASQVVQVAAMLWPAFLALGAREGELLPAAVGYAEAAAWTYAAKNCLKYLFPKSRPYAYRADALPPELLEEVDESFPSGHAALAFCAASYFATLCLELAPDRPESPWLVGGGFALAIASCALRVVSGNHFIGDVAAGSALGAGVGWLAAKVRLRPGASPAAQGGALNGAGTGSRAPFTGTADLGLGAGGPSLRFRLNL